MAYTKLHQALVTSTIWREPNPTRLLWVTMMALADQHGEVMASIPGLADMARISVDECEAGINTFLSPDKYSRTPDFDGRRVEKIDGGWSLLNHKKYRLLCSRDDAKEKTAERVARHRAKAKAVTETQSNADVTLAVHIAEAEAEAEVKTNTNTKTARKRAAPGALVSVEDLVDAGVDRQHAADWLLARKSKSLPLTPTAWADTQAEAIKAGLTVPEAIARAAANGWAGFKAAWLANSESGRSGVGPPSYLAEKQAEAAKWARPSKPDFEFIDMEADDAPLVLR